MNGVPRRSAWHQHSRNAGSKTRAERSSIGITGFSATKAEAAPQSGVLFRESFADVVRTTGFTHGPPKGWTNKASG